MGGGTDEVGHGGSREALMVLNCCEHEKTDRKGGEGEGRGTHG